MRPLGGHLTTRVMVMTFCFITMTKSADKAENKNNCEYDVDLTANFIKITCQGSSSQVNVYADTAHVSGDEVEGGGGNSDQATASRSKSDKEKNKGNAGVKSGDGKGSASSGQSRSSRRRKFPPEGEHSGYKPSNKKGMTSSSLQQDHWRAWNLPKPDSAFSTVVWNATQKLDDAKKKLSSYANFIRNISSQLEDGDHSLKADMERLKKTSNSATVLKEGITAAMRNQFNFMRSALLTRNNEVERLVTTLKVLVDVTSHGLQGALTAHKSAMEQVSHVNATMAAIRRMISRELRRKRRSKGDKGNKQKACPKEISAFGAGRYRTVEGIPIGSFMVESLNPHNPGMVWIMPGSEHADEIMEFDIENDIDYSLVGRYIPLPFECAGTGHAIFRRHFYCHEWNTNRIAKYHVKRMNIIGEVEIPELSKTPNKYPYQSGQFTDVDMAVDEFGLWAIYATDASRGNVVISKINHQNMEVEKTWETDYLKRRLGNAFMICGVMYATDSSSDAPTFIRYSYDTQTAQHRNWEPGKLPFANRATPTTTSTATPLSKGSAAQRLKDRVNSVMLSYDFRTSTLFSWNNGRIEKFAVYFKDREP